MLYIQYYIKTVHFWLKYNGLIGIVRRTTKLVEGGHCGIQAHMPIRYYFYFFTFLTVFFKIQKGVTFYLFCRVSYVFSNSTMLSLTLSHSPIKSSLPAKLITIYTVSQKNWATFLRPITLEILNRSSPNLAQIKVSSFWTSCQSLFKSTLENSGAI